MKKTLLLPILTLLFTFQLQAQSSTGSIYPCSVLPIQFSNSCYQNCWLDTLDLGGDTNIITLNPSCNLWQIGANQKPAFGTPGQDFGIETDLDSAYPTESSCSFWVKIPENPLQWASSILLFEHRYTTDSLSDGGTIEYSCNGTEWANAVGNPTGQVPLFKNFLNFPMVQDFGGYFEQGNIPTLDDVNYAFTGETNAWQWSGVHFVWTQLVKSAQTSAAGCDFNTTDSIQFRFTFTSDSTFDNQPGWMIRNLVVGSADIGGGINDFFLSDNLVFPNPGNDRIKLIQGLSNTEVNILNTLGQVQMKSIYTENGLDISLLPKGMYWLQFQSTKGFQVTKLLKE
jgi:hypothetical protein